MIQVREYQQRAINSLYSWWVNHSPDQVPLLVLPTGAGKSIVIAELVRMLWDTWPDYHPRTVVLVPSKELAEQNAAKLAAVLPAHRSVGYYSAGLGQKRPDADVIVATIGSIYREAHLLGAIRCVVIDEAHLVNPSGAGRYRKFLDDLGALCPLVSVGLTATPFRGNGVWLSDGERPLFHGIACEVKMGELLAAGHLAPLVRPADVLATRIDTDDLAVVSGDYRLDDLAERVDQYIPGVVEETLRIAADRKKWIAFTPNVATAEHLSAAFMAAGVSAAVVCGETHKVERARLVADFRAGRIRCLVTVLALATGFDVPDVDCVIWCRPTRSPVLYCFDTETEILTSHGWIGVDEVRAGDCALAMDMGSGRGKWSRVLGVVRRPMEPTEQWVEYDAPRANFRVTGQHRMIFKTSRESEWRIGTAAEMAAYRDSVYMPTAVHIDQPGVPLSDDELYLIGMLMTDGTWSPVQAQISQSERYPEVLKRIEETLDRMNIQWSKKKISADSNFIQRYDRWVFTVSMGEPRKGSTRNGIRYLQPYLHKDLAPALMSLSKGQFIKLVEGMWDGDGVKMAYVTEWTVRGKTIVSVRKTCIERLQALAVMHGFTAHLRWERAGRKNPLGVITIKDQDWRSVGGPRPEKRPQIAMLPATDEDVWCVETEHGTVVTRRHGKVTVMGNCQGAGRGTRPAHGKADCLWLDFSDTTSRLGPIDQIRGRRKGPPADVGAPYALCDACGAHVRPASLTHCPECGALLREEEERAAQAASNAAILSAQLTAKILGHAVTDVRYSRHSKAGSPDSLRVDYYSGIKRVASEWVCLEHAGFAGAKAAAWWAKRAPRGFAPGGTSQALEWINTGYQLRTPSAIRVNESGKWPEIVGFTWSEEPNDPRATDQPARDPAPAA